MINWRNNKISNKQKQVTILLYRYRALTNEHLRRLIFGHLGSDSNGQKANISRYTAGLRNMKLIESFSCYPYSKEYIHCLTTKGVEFVKEQVIIDSDNPLVGFDGIHFGDFSTTILKPGLKNLEHTMMLLDFAFKINADVRHNLYAVKNYFYLDRITDNQFYQKAGKVRPDGEILTKKNGLLGCIEIDTGSERFEQLVAKFNNYRRYFDYCVKNDIKIEWEAMMFVCKESNIEIKKDLRFKTIIKAVCEGLQYYVWSFDVLIFNRGGKSNIVSVSSILSNQPELLNDMEVILPSKVNPVFEKKKKDEEIRVHEVAKKERIRREEQLIVEKQIKQQKFEYQKIQEERKVEEIEVKDSKKGSLIGKLFGKL